MKEFNLEIPLWTNLIVFKLTGFLPPNNNSSYRRFFPAYAFFVRVFIIGIFSILYFIGTWIVHEDVNGIVINGHLNIHYMAAVLKSYQIWRARDEIGQLFQISTKEIMQAKSKEEREVLTSRFRYWKVMHFTFVTSIVMTLGWYALEAILKGNRDLPLPSWYPFQQSMHPFYEICTLQQWLIMVYVGLAHSNADTFLGALLIYMSCQCKMLKLSLQSFESKPHGTREERLEHLIRAIKHHQQILIFAKTAQKLFALPTLAQLFSNVLTCTVCMYIMHEEGFDSPKFTQAFIYIFSVLCQLFLYCWLGQLLISESENLPETLGESILWYNQSNTFKKTYLFFLHRSQQTIAIKAGGFAELSLQTFTTIMRTSYSYLTVLIQVAD